MGKAGQGEGSIYQRKSDGLWCAAVSTGLYNAKGKPIRKYLYGKTRREVAEKKRNAQAALSSGVTLDRNPTLADHLDTWYEEQRTHLRPNTLSTYERAIRHHIKPRLGRLKLAAIEPSHIIRWQAGLAKDGGAGGKPLMASTIRIARAVLVRALGDAVRYGWLTRNPAALAKAPKVGERHDRRLTRDDARAILAAFEDDRDYPLVCVLLGCGLRIGEALGLEWGSVDLDRARLQVKQQVSKSGTGLYSLSPPKSRAGVRSVPLPPFVVDALRRHRDAQDGSSESVVSVGSVGSGLVFPGESGVRASHTFRERFGRRLRAAGIEDVSPHDLRHLYGALLVLAGTQAKVIQEVMGHASITVTMDTYAYLLPGVDQAAAEAIERALGK